MDGAKKNSGSGDGGVRDGGQKEGRKEGPTARSIFIGSAQLGK